VSSTHFFITSLETISLTLIVPKQEVVWAPTAVDEYSTLMPSFMEGNFLKLANLSQKPWVLLC
jgi:hypothetical protein